MLLYLLILTFKELKKKKAGGGTQNFLGFFSIVVSPLPSLMETEISCQKF